MSKSKKPSSPKKKRSTKETDTRPGNASDSGVDERNVEPGDAYSDPDPGPAAPGADAEEKAEAAPSKVSRIDRKPNDVPADVAAEASVDNVSTIGTWELNPQGLLFTGKVTFEQWRKLGNTLRDMRDTVMFWLGDWWLMGETVYGEMASQEAKDELEIETGYTYNTVRTAAYVCSRMLYEQRLSGVSFKHHQVVAPIDDEGVRGDLLSKARENQWTVAQLEDAARPYKRSTKGTKNEAGLFDDDKFNLVLADPPWKYQDTTTPNRKVEKEYPTMSLVDIMALRDSAGKPVQDIVDKNAVLFLWATGPKNEEAMQVITAWGFEYQTQMVWDKGKDGLGHYARGRHELLLIATKGQPGTPQPKDRPSSIQSVASLRKWLGLAPSTAKLAHSEKPAEFRMMIERMYRKSVRIELFSRHAVKGWSRWGLDAPEEKEATAEAAKSHRKTKRVAKAS